MNGEFPETAIWLSDQGNVGRGGAPVEEVAMPRENPAQQQVETPDDGQINRLNARYRGPLTSFFLRRLASVPTRTHFTTANGHPNTSSQNT